MSVDVTVELTGTSTDILAGTALADKGRGTYEIYGACTAAWTLTVKDGDGTIIDGENGPTFAAAEVDAVAHVPYKCHVRKATNRPTIDIGGTVTDGQFVIRKVDVRAYGAV